MLDAISRNKTMSQIVRFILVGGAATATHFAVLISLTNGFGVRPWVANGSAFCVALFVTWIGQSVWVFSHKKENLNGVTVARFLVVALTGLSANSGIMFVCERLLENPVIAGFLIATTSVPFLTFILSKFWVFQMRNSFEGESK